jgi:hypothetical protein
MSDEMTTPRTDDVNAAQIPPQEIKRTTIKVKVECNIDLALVRRQKHALIGIREGATVSSEQEEAAEGILNLLDFIQDSILEQGLATEDEVFPRLPGLFDDPTGFLEQAA